MTETQFITLDLKQQNELVNKIGFYQSTRYDYGFTVKLYKLSNLFIEVFYTPMKTELFKIKIVNI